MSVVESSLMRDSVSTMPFDSKGKRIGTGQSSSPILSKWLCLLIVGLPITCLYIGYSIGMHFLPEHNIMPDRKVIMDASSLNYSYYKTRNLTAKFIGNLGNEMFQYAALYGLAQANGFKPVVPVRLKLVKMFPHLKAAVVASPEPGARWDKFREFKAMKFDQRAFSLNFMKNIELLGYFQSWRYFDHIKVDLRQQFTFPQQATAKAHAVLQEASSGAKEMFFKNSIDHSHVFVGIHIRRGDLLTDKNIEKGYVTATQSYINAAMDHFINKYHQVVFIVCSDDMAWSKKNVKMRGNNPVIFSPFEHDYPAMDMCLLSQCNHTIMTVGTFGWWAAWLAGGETIYYKNFPSMFSPVSEEFRGIDYFLSEWYGN